MSKAAPINAMIGPRREELSAPREPEAFVAFMVRPFQLGVKAGTRLSDATIVAKCETCLCVPARGGPAPIGRLATKVMGSGGLEPGESRELDAIVRGLAAAAKTLRLYPPTSDIPRQSVETLLGTLETRLQTSPALTFELARDGFTVAGTAVGAGVPGARDISDQLRAHGAADVTFAQSVDTDQLLKFLTTILAPPEQTRGDGGLASALAAAGVRSVTVSGVHLTLSDQAVPGEGEDVDEFLKGLAADAGRLSQWVEAGAKGDPAAFAESLAELSHAAGQAGRPDLVRTLGTAFSGLDATGKDALLSAGIGRSGDLSLIADLLKTLAPGDVADALVGGPRGGNALQLSSAVNGLPLGERLGPVLAEVQSMMQAEGHTEAEVAFFDRMVQARQSGRVEAPLADRQASYRQVAQAAQVSPEELSESLGRTQTEAQTGDERSVETMLSLLDRHDDFDAWCRGLDALTAMVPRLINRGELALADRIVEEMGARAAQTDKPWPELTDKAREAIAKALSPRAVHSLLAAVARDPSSAEAARRILVHGGEAAQKTIVMSALASSEPDAMQAAELLVGRRMEDLLAEVAPQVKTPQIATLVRRLAASSGPRAAQALDGIVMRPDAKSRQEAAKGLMRGGMAAVRHLQALLKDADIEVAIMAARALGTTGLSPAAAALTHHLEEMNVDGKDFPLAREIMQALGRMPDAEARDALTRLAARRALFKTGHFAEVQKVAKEALKAQQKLEATR